MTKYAFRLLVFIYDALRRVGLDRTAEALAQEALLNTDQVTACMQIASQALGPTGSNGSGAGSLLAQWWGGFWELVVWRASGQAAVPVPPAITVGGVMKRFGDVVIPSPPPAPPQYQYLQQTSMDQRLRLMVALQRTGLIGRDLNSLTMHEKSRLVTALRSIATQEQQQRQQQHMLRGAQQGRLPVERRISRSVEGTPRPYPVSDMRSSVTKRTRSDSGILPQATFESALNMPDLEASIVGEQSAGSLEILGSWRLSGDRKVAHHTSMDAGCGKFLVVKTGGRVKFLEVPSLRVAAEMDLDIADFRMASTESKVHLINYEDLELAGITCPLTNMNQLPLVQPKVLYWFEDQPLAYDILFDPQPKLVASILSTGHLHVYSLVTGEELVHCKIEPVFSKVKFIAENWVALESPDMIQRFELASQKVIKVMRTSTKFVDVHRLNNNDIVLATESAIQVHSKDTDFQRTLWSTPTVDDAISCVAVQGDTVIVGTRNGRLLQCDPKDDTKELYRMDSSIRSLFVTSDNVLVAILADRSINTFRLPGNFENADFNFDPVTMFLNTEDLF